MRGRKRVGQRGAAIVEAALMFLLIAPFFGFNLFIYTTYRDKIDTQQQTREATMYYAAHACSQKTPSPKAPVAGNSGTLESGNNTNNSPNAAPVLNSQASTSKVFSGMGGAFINASSATQASPLSVFGHGNTVHSQGYTLCNEELWGGTFALFSSLMSFVGFGLQWFGNMIGGYIKGMF
jgi:hypothetical protein